MWRIVIGLMLLTTGVIVGLWLASRPPGRSPWTRSGAGLTLDQVRALSELVTVRAEIADVQETTLAGYTGSLKAAVLVRGELLVGIDLSQARFERRDDLRHRAVLHLPRPRVISARLDMKRAKVFGIAAHGLWLIVPGGADVDAAVINWAYREAQGTIEKTVLAPELQQRAKAQAEQVLREFGRSLGWELEVRWSE